MNISELAKQAHFNSKTWVDIYQDDITTRDVLGYLEAFAALVAAHEREECAKICDEVGKESASHWPHRFSNMIRARGEA
jgi:hypothetical protein